MLQAHASVCKRMQAYASACKRMQAYAIEAAII
jgi:hypothetical protein